MMKNGYQRPMEKLYGIDWVEADDEWTLDY